MDATVEGPAKGARALRTCAGVHKPKCCVPQFQGHEANLSLLERKQQTTNANWPTVGC